MTQGNLQKFRLIILPRSMIAEELHMRINLLERRGFFVCIGFSRER
jgi:hypothetical protein